MADTHHAEWLSLLDVSGPFLSLPVLETVFPQGLDVADADHTGKLRLAYEEWAEEQQRADPDPAIHDAWIRFILTETLGLTPEVLLEGEGISEELEFTSPEHGETIRPDFVVFDPEDEPGTRTVRLLISVWPADTELDQPVDDARWTASPIDRMIALCRSEHVGLRLGLVTNGERWAFVDAPVGETSAHASCYANLWGPEPLTLRAFRSLLGLRRFFGVAENDRLDAMLVESANYQTEVTDQLGFQVRRAVEVLVQAIDRADADTGRTLLADTDPARIYEAALTVMMRLVFLFSAEERGLLRLGDPMYDQFYAVSTLHAQLQEAADQVGPEVLERRQDAWSRLLGTFRAIYGGVHHQDLQIIPYGSSLFDPDRFPFLEGRTDDTTWRETDSLPLPIDNRTVLLLLRSLQMLDLGKGKGARKLSFRALDIEQIGHVYETLLDHSAYRASEPMVSLQGNQGREPEFPVSKLIELMLHDSDEPLVDFLKAELKKGGNPIRKALEKGRTPEPGAIARLRRSCGGDDVLLGKLLPFHELIRLDPWGDPVVIQEGTVFVTAGDDRRSTGTHYTPRALTEEIVQYALEPLVYRGPAEGKDREEWQLKSPDEILELKVCDPAMGSGAFLVQACRYLSERLVEAWEQAGQTTTDAGSADLFPGDAEERLSLARRLVADRCLYGVDVNPLAVEMAKLSLWLITLAKETSFAFLDHALKCGDSLLGLNDLDQVRYFHPDVDAGRRLHHNLWDPTETIDRAIAEARRLREELEAFTVTGIYDAHQKKELSGEAEAAVDTVRALGDIVVAALMKAASQSASPDSVLARLANDANEAIRFRNDFKIDELRRNAHSTLNEGTPAGKPSRRPFHWPVEFPEVFGARAGFDAFVMNPPFLGGKRISGRLGDDYRAYLVAASPSGRRGIIDLMAFFLLRVASLLNCGGTAGSLATNTATQGDTRYAGLDYLTANGWQITRASSDRPWPGSATLEIVELWIHRGPWSGSYVLDGESVTGVSPYLDIPLRVTWQPQPLHANDGRSHIGVIVVGAGFVLTEQEASELIEDDQANSDVVKPYLNGKDLNSHPEQHPSRWIIDFSDLSLNEAKRYEGPFSRVEKLVKPQRQKVKRKAYRERWWQFAETVPSTRAAIAGMDQVLVRAQVTSTWAFVYVPNRCVFDSKLTVFSLPPWHGFSALQSSIHWEWALRYGTTLRLDLSYTPISLFDPFPFPEPFPETDEAGRRFHALRQQIMLERSEGLTSTFKRVNDPDERSTDILQLREAQRDLDASVLTSYGWDDLPLEYTYVESRAGGRFAFSPPLRAEVLSRLLELNHRRNDAQRLEPGVSGVSGASSGARTQDNETLFDPPS